MEKIINIPLTKDGAAVSSPLSAGFRGEHKATALVFTPDSGLLSLINAAVAEGFEVVCRTDLAVLSGEYFRGEEKGVGEISEPFFLTAPMTLSGLDATVIFSLVKKSESKVVSELFKAQVKLCFEDSGLPYVSQKVPKEGGTYSAELEAFEQKVSDATALIEGKTAAVKGFADRSATQLSRVLEAADRLDGRVAEVEQKLANGEFDGADGLDGKDGLDADLSAVANAVRGSAVGMSVEVGDISPLPHNIDIALDRNLLAGTSFVDVPNVGYCRSDRLFPLVKGISYTVKIKTKGGVSTKSVVIEKPQWLSQHSPAYTFGAIESCSFEAFYAENYALFIGIPACEIVSAEIVAITDNGLANLPVTLNSGEGDQVYRTDPQGKISFPSTSSHLSASAGEFYAVRLSYNRDVNKAIPAVDGVFSPESENPQSGVAVAEAVSGKADNWTTLINTTLTEEQSGVSEVYIEIPNWEMFKTISRMKLLVDIAATEAITAQSAQISIKNYGGGAYNSALCWTNCGACNAGEKLYFRGIYDFFPFYLDVDNREKKSYVGFFTEPVKYSGANSVTYPFKVNDGFTFTFWNSRPPHLHIKLASGGIIGAGSKIVMEVC